MDLLGTLGTVGAFLAIIVFLVVVHELGHFIVAKRAGITVEEFGIGFPPRIASFRWHATRYSINWIPLGGFVKMLGEDGEIELQRLREQGLSDHEMTRAVAGAFNRKPLGIRLLVLLAGVVMNFVLAGVLFSVASSMPTPVGLGPLTVATIQDGSPAQGTLRVGDVITAADGRTFDRSRELTAYVASRAGTPVTLEVIRADEPREVTLTPRALTEEDRLQGKGPIGISYTPESIGELPSTVRDPIDAVARGFGVATEGAVQIPGGLARAIGGLIGLGPNAGDARGPIGIAEVTGEVLQSPLVSQIQFLGILSVNLAVLNVLPFPPLDGGRMAVVLIEGLRRRRLPAEREALIYLTGFALLIALVILISIQDIQRLLGG